VYLTVSCTNNKVWEKGKRKKRASNRQIRLGTAGQHVYLTAACTNKEVWEKAEGKESIKQADKVRDSGTACVFNSCLHQQ
jgi:hypothetical protein